jgi:hypothetical protein
LPQVVPDSKYDVEISMRLRNGLFLATFGLFASCGLSAQQPQSGTAGEPAPDAKRSGVVNEKSAEQPFEEMNPNPNYSNTEKKVDQAPVYAPGTDASRRDDAAGEQKSGEPATTPRPSPQR